VKKWEAGTADIGPGFAFGDKGWDGMVSMYGRRRNHGRKARAPSVFLTGSEDVRVACVPTPELPAGAFAWWRFMSEMGRVRLSGVVKELDLPFAA
jgi:hypothetical protein